MTNFNLQCGSQCIFLNTCGYVLYDFQHTGYQPRGGFPDDIALMELPEGVYIEKRFIMPVCLPPHDFVIPEGSPCWITGWGNTDGEYGGPTLSLILFSFTFKIFSAKNQADQIKWDFCLYCIKAPTDIFEP